MHKKARNRNRAFAWLGCAMPPKGQRSGGTIAEQGTAAWRCGMANPYIRPSVKTMVHTSVPSYPHRPTTLFRQRRKTENENAKLLPQRGKPSFFFFLFFFLSRNRVSFCRCLRPPKENTKRKAPFTFCLRFRKKNHKRKEYIRKDKNYPCSRNMTITK